MSKAAIKSIMVYTASSRSFDEEDPSNIYEAYRRAAEDKMRNSNFFHSDICKWKHYEQKVLLRLMRWLLWKDITFQYINLPFLEVNSTNKEIEKCLLLLTQ